MIQFTIPGRPRGKGRPRFVRATGHTYTPAETRSYEALVRAIAFDAMKGRPPIQGAVRLYITAIFDVPKSWSKKAKTAALHQEEFPVKRPDIDNCGKGVLDGINGIVIKDDCQVVGLNILKRYGEIPGVLVSVYPVASPE